MNRSVTALLLSICIALPASAEDIRVLLAEHTKSVTIESISGLIIEQSPGREAGKRITIGPGYIGTRPVRIRSVDGVVSLEGRRYRGTLEIRRSGDSEIRVINELDIEDYLKGVIAEEIPHDWEPEALKAQAVASRTYALYLKKNAGRRPYHITASVKSQLYGGVRSERDAAVMAVRDTTGLVLTYQGRVIPAFYHSSCGGRTEDAGELWDIDAPYLKGVDCSCQEISKYGVWEKRISINKALAGVRGLGYRLNNITSMGLGRITRAGRVKEIVICDQDRIVEIPAERFRSSLGYGVLPSVFFEVSVVKGEIVFSGRGMGHGVGLCQWGAREMAQRGHDFVSILRHYYPGTSLERLDKSIR